MNKIWFEYANKEKKLDQTFINSGDGTQSNTVFNGPILIDYDKVQRVATEENINQLVGRIEMLMRQHNLKRDFCLSVQAEQGYREAVNLQSQIADSLESRGLRVYGRSGSFEPWMPREEGVIVKFGTDRINIMVWGL